MLKILFTSFSYQHRPCSKIRLKAGACDNLGKSEGYKAKSGETNGFLSLRSAEAHAQQINNPLPFITKGKGLYALA